MDTFFFTKRMKSSGIEDRRNIPKILLFIMLVSYSDMGVAVLYNPDRISGPQFEWVKVVFSAMRYIVPIGWIFYARLVMAGRRIGSIRMGLFVPIILFSFVSIAWSLNPWFSAENVYIEIIVIFALKEFYEKIGRAGVFSTITIFLGVCVTLSIFVAIAAPDIGTHSAGDLVSESLIGNWRGILLHKNILGPFSFSLFSVVCAGETNMKTRGVWAYVLLVASAVTVYMTDSATTILGLCIFVSLLWATTHKYTIFVPMLVVGSLAAIVSFDEILNFIFGLSSRDNTLSGRTIVWTRWLGEAMESPWFGHGYRISNDPDVASHFQKIIFRAAGHPHSAYLELLYNIGVVGGIIFLVPIIYSLIIAFRKSSSGEHFSTFAFCYLVTILVMGTVDVVIFGYQAQIGIIVLAVVLGVSYTPCSRNEPSQRIFR